MKQKVVMLTDEQALQRVVKRKVPVGGLVTPTKSEERMHEKERLTTETIFKVI